MSEVVGNTGWNRPRRPAGGSSGGIGRRAPSPLRGIWIGAVVVLLAVLGGWLAIRHERGPSAEDRKTVGKTPGKSASSRKNGGLPGSVPASAALSVPGKAANRASVDSGQEAGPGQDAEAGTNDVAGAEKRKVLFANPMDQLMSMVMPRAPGDSVPPVPINDDMEFTPEQERQMFERLVALDDDSDEALERKELVQAMRNEYVELKKERGWRFVDYIKALEAKAKLDSDILTESWKIHETVFNDPDISDEKYLETLQKINKVLGERGIKPIKPPEEDLTSGNQQKEGAAE